MGHRRLIALAALAACHTADAEPTLTSGLTPPAGWQALPAIAQAAREALEDPSDTDGAEAWGEPSLGCYAVWWSMRGEGKAPAIAQRVLDGLGGDVAITSSSVVQPVAGNAAPVQELTFTFERKPGAMPKPPLEGPPSPYKGRVRAKLGGGRVVVLACFANDREPAACDAPCSALLGAMK